MLLAIGFVLFSSVAPKEFCNSSQISELSTYTEIDCYISNDVKIKVDTVHSKIEVEGFGKEAPEFDTNILPSSFTTKTLVMLKNVNIGSSYKTIQSNKLELREVTGIYNKKAFFRPSKDLTFCSLTISRSTFSSNERELKEHGMFGDPLFLVPCNDTNVEVYKSTFTQIRDFEAVFLVGNSISISSHWAYFEYNMFTFNKHFKCLLSFLSLPAVAFKKNVLLNNSLGEHLLYYHLNLGQSYYHSGNAIDFYANLVSHNNLNGSSLLEVDNSDSTIEGLYMTSNRFESNLCRFILNLTDTEQSINVDFSFNKYIDNKDIERHNSTAFWITANELGIYYESFFNNHFAKIYDIDIYISRDIEVRGNEFKITNITKFDGCPIWNIRSSSRLCTGVYDLSARSLVILNNEAEQNLTLNTCHFKEKELKEGHKILFWF